MRNILTPAELERYHRTGYHFPLTVLSTQEALAVRQQLEAYEASTGGPLKAEYRRKAHLLFTFLDQLVYHPNILAAVKGILGPNLLCWNTTCFIKEVGGGDYVSWHQDANYWGLSSPEVVTAWIALSDAPVESGPMRFLPESHQHAYGHRDTFAKHNLLSRGQEIEVEVDESKAIQTHLKAGEFSLHHVMLVHSSCPNQSTDRRLGFAIRYIPTHVCQTAGPKDSASLVCGVDTYHHFRLDPRPTTNLDPAMLALHQQAVEEKAQILFKGSAVMESQAGAGLDVLRSGVGK